VIVDFTKGVALYCSFSGIFFYYLCLW